MCMGIFQRNSKLLYLNTEARAIKHMKSELTALVVIKITNQTIPSIFCLISQYYIFYKKKVKCFNALILHRNVEFTATKPTKTNTASNIIILHYRSKNYQ